MLANACETMMGHHAFWVLSGLIDRSCEAGTRGTGYLKCVNTLGLGPNGESFCFPSSLIDQMKRAVNGNLVDILRTQIREVHDDVSWVWNGHRTEPDIRWGGGSHEVVVEVKAIWEGTLPKFYGPSNGKEGSLAKDSKKLQRLRDEGFHGALFQVVFFREMPNYRYPSGQTYVGGNANRWELNKARKDSLVQLDIASQYQMARNFLRTMPVWPSHPPTTVSLELPEEYRSSTKAWFEGIFHASDSSWNFDSAKQLQGAKVGCAIWKY